MTNFLPSPSFLRKTSAVITAAVASIALNACSSNNIAPDGYRKDVAKICLEDGATLRANPGVISTGPDNNYLMRLDLDGDVDSDSGEAVCAPAPETGVPYRDEPNNGRWFEINGKWINDQAQGGELTLPDGHKAPNIFGTNLVKFANILEPNETGWVNNRRVSFVGKDGKLRS